MNGLRIVKRIDFTILSRRDTVNRTFNSAVVLMTLLIAGCGAKEKLGEGVVHRTETVVSGSFGEFRKETYLKNSMPYRTLAFFKDGKRYFESYTTRLDTISFNHYIEFFPSGEIKEFTTRESDKNEITSGFTYYPNGIMKSRINSDTHVEEYWDETGAKEAEFLAPNSEIKKITKWYHNGQEKEMSELLNTQRNGKWFQWDSLGHQIRNEIYVNGKLKK